jgi:hypothetical protein
VSEIAQASVRQQLQMLKAQTRMTGALHEAQVLQLKMWPMVVFDVALSTSFTWDPDEKVVAFKVDMPKGKKTLTWWKPRVEALNSWVQELLGEDWMILVSDGKNKFRGNRKIHVRGAGTGSEPKPGADAGTKGS